MSKFKRENVEMIPIEYVEDEHEEENDFKASFWWNNKRYYLENFIIAHNNPFIGYDFLPEFINAYESDNYFNPLYIEIVDGEYVNVYSKT